jgi:phosphoribosylformylglycinamidine synthase
LNTIGKDAPTIKDAFFKRAFNTIQVNLEDNILAGHGGLITTLLEMCFADNNLGAKIDFSVFEEKHHQIFFAENIGIVFQAKTMLQGKQTKRKQCRFLQNGNCYYRSDFRPRLAN